MIASELASCATELERVQRDIMAMTRDRPDGWRLRLISLRRQLQAHIGAMATISIPNGSLDGEYRRTLSQMRTTLAVHQAEWPVVSTDLDDERYQASVATVHEANRAFLDTVQKILAALDAGR